MLTVIQETRKKRGPTIHHMNQTRPRLTRQEISFLIQTLETYKTVATEKQKEMRIREARVQRLKRQFITTRDQQILSTLRNEQELLMKDRVAKYHHQERVAEILAGRFTLLLKGKVKHSANITSFFLGSNKV